MAFYLLFSAEEIVDRLFEEVTRADAYELTVDLASQSVVCPDGRVLSFAVEAHRKHCLIHGLDDIGMTLCGCRQDPSIRGKAARIQPWLFQNDH
jgi:3-isopropylmalate/(R)-2-methylmalate dehydratase small subunit